MDVDAPLDCAICFETISESTVLPCACKVSYCNACWDRALASSLNANDQARCPTCRTPVRVDFDADECRLVFSREADDQVEADRTEIQQEIDTGEIERMEASLRDIRTRSQQREAEGESLRVGESARVALLERIHSLSERVEIGQRLLSSGRERKRLIEKRRRETIERLANQAAPAMIRLLERFCAKHHVPIYSYSENPREELKKLEVAVLQAQLENMADCRDKFSETEAIVSELVSRAVDPGMLASFLVSATLEAPPCVCGSSLERLSGKERARRYISKAVPAHQIEIALQRLIARGSSNIICDLCDEKVPMKAFIWTCKNMNCTILHAATYDVCDSCFSRHACAVTTQTV